MQGFSRLCPKGLRKPKPFPMIATMAAGLLHRRQRRRAIWVLIGHGGYLRPSENIKLRKCDLIMPRGTLTSHWSLLIAAQELGKVTKIGEMDDSVLWDTPYLHWLTPAFEMITAGDQQSGLWDFTYPKWCKK